MNNYKPQLDRIEQRLDGIDWLLQIGQAAHQLNALSVRFPDVPITLKAGRILVGSSIIGIIGCELLPEEWDTALRLAAGEAAMTRVGGHWR